MPKRRVAEPTAEYLGRRKPTNLSLDPDAIVRGEAYAIAHDVSLSQLVSQLLRGLPVSSAGSPAGSAVGGVKAQWPDVVTRLYGLARRGDDESERKSERAIDDYHDYLYRKYGGTP
jgi:hypothetical protein